MDPLGKEHLVDDGSLGFRNSQLEFVDGTLYRCFVSDSLTMFVQNHVANDSVNYFSVCGEG